MVFFFFSILQKLRNCCDYIVPWKNLFCHLGESGHLGRQRYQRKGPTANDPRLKLERYYESMMCDSDVFYVEFVSKNEYYNLYLGDAPNHS